MGSQATKWTTTWELGFESRRDQMSTRYSKVGRHVALLDGHAGMCQLGTRLIRWQVGTYWYAVVLLCRRSC